MKYSKNLSKLKADFRQFGFSGFILRVVKFFLRLIGINYNTYYYMVTHIDAKEQEARFNKSQVSFVQELSYDDFLLGDSEVFTKKKLLMIRKRIEDGSYKAYGILNNKRLLYSCWISLIKLESSNADIGGTLAEDEGLLLDAYCSPFARGKGLHSAMNAYRLWQLSQKGKRKAIVIVLKENTPAYKSQLNAGFEVAFTYYVGIWWGKVFTNYYKQYKRYKEYASR